MKTKKKINVVDILVLAVILAAAIFFVWRFTHREVTIANSGVVTYTVLAEAMPARMYEDIAKSVPSRPQLMAKGGLVPGFVNGAEATPVTLTALEKADANNPMVVYVMEPEGEFVNVLFTLEATIDLNSLTSELGTQEIRTGRSHIVKTKYFEVVGTILSVERPD